MLGFYKPICNIVFLLLHGLTSAEQTSFVWKKVSVFNKLTLLSIQSKYVTYSNAWAIWSYITLSFLTLALTEAFTSVMIQNSDLISCLIFVSAYMWCNLPQFCCHWRGFSGHAFPHEWPKCVFAPEWRWPLGCHVKCSEMCEGCVAVSYYRCLEDKNLCNISYKVFTPCVCVFVWCTEGQWD